MSISVNLASPSQSGFSKHKTAARDPNRPLHIELVDPKDYPKIAEIGKQWEQIAIEKMKITDQSDKASAEFRSSLYVTSKMQLLNSKELNEEMVKVFVCVDLEGNIHGFAQARLLRDEIYGSLLCTNPINIRCKANALESERVENVGLTFLQFADKMMEKKRLPLTGYPLSSAKPFYAKYGFKEIDSTGNIGKSPPPPASKL